MHVIERSSLDRLLEAIRHRGYRLIGPTRRDNAIVYDDIGGAADLPAGWIDEPEPGRYGLKHTRSPALFGHTAGPHTWKSFIYPPKTLLWRARKKGNKYDITHTESGSEIPKQAFIGVRPCELRAIGLQDTVFIEGLYIDRGYHARRENALIVAVNCGRASSTCFCASMGAGPKAGLGYDLALTEVVQGKRHYFTVESGTLMGQDILAELTLPAASEAEIAAAQGVVDRAATQMGRTVDTEDLPAILVRRRDDPRWEETAKRCLTCGNCTMSCPTCFCHTVEDVTDLTGDNAERWRKWDSCFTIDFTYIHGGSVRKGGASRYRQWLTHKLSSWVEQFGSMGCVGCGRCIAWCPVGIDLTEEVRVLRERDGAKPVTAERESHKEMSHAGT